MPYRIILKWRFIRELIEDYGWAAAIVIIALIVVLYEIFTGGIVLDLIRPVTNRIGGFFRKMDHSVKQYPDDTTNRYSGKYSEENPDSRVAELEAAIKSLREQAEREQK